MNETVFLELLEGHFNLELSAVFRKARKPKTDGIYTLESVTTAFDAAKLSLFDPAISWHIVGSNGKGTCTHYLEQIYRRQGYTTGSFTSPHLLEINERICIDGKGADYQLLTQAYHVLEQKLDPKLFTELSFFELLFLIAVETFQTIGCDVVLYEAGLGGRFDCTKVARAQRVLLTSISLEHTAWLGNDEAAILSEKMAIVDKQKPQTLYFVAPPHESELLCSEFKKNLKLLQKENPALKGVMLKPGHENPIHNYKMLCEMITSYQGSDSGLQEVVVQPNQKYLGLKDPPGRYEQFEQGQDRYVFDCAHNEAAISALLKRIIAELAPEIKFVQLLTAFLPDKSSALFADRLQEFETKLQTLGVTLTSETVKIQADTQVGSMEAVFENLSEEVNGPGLTVITGTFRLYQAFRSYMESLGATPLKLVD